MRNQFAGYYRPTEEQFSELWKECIFAFDTNTLLNVYRYTSNTRESFLGIIEKLKDRIWITHQAAYEYHENRLEVISQQMELYDQIEKELNDSSQKLKKLLEGYKRHPLIDIPKLMEISDSSFQKIESFLGEVKANHPDYLTSDDLRDRITQLFDAKVGLPYSEDELEKKYKEAEVRFKRHIPPGYEDLAKEGTRKYGDYIIWSQLLDLAESQKKPLIFITDDAKKDWWLFHKGKTIGPKPQLIQEMLTRSGMAFYMYQTDRFISYAQKFLDLKDQPQVVDEVKEVRQRDYVATLYEQILASEALARGYQKMLEPQNSVINAIMAQERDYQKMLEPQNSAINAIMAQTREYTKMLEPQNSVINAIMAQTREYTKMLAQPSSLASAVLAQIREYEKINPLQRPVISEAIQADEEEMTKPTLTNNEAESAPSLIKQKREIKTSTKMRQRGRASKKNT